MADESVGPEGQKPASPRERRTPAGGGRPARARATSGNPGYAGYEYQIDVTVWAALDLMMAKNATATIVIEPPSDEDLEAAVADPDTASLGLTAIGASFHLTLQAKTRSGSPWSSSALADVLLGKAADAADKGARRSRPLEMLRADPRRRYVFVTNEATTEALRPHEGENLFDFPEVDLLPPYCREDYDAATQAELASRLLLLTGVTRELLSARIGMLLSQHGHVSASKHPDCLRDLREVVRRRIQGADDGRWTRSDLLEVLALHGGSVAPTRDMDHYVRPRSYEAIKDRLDTAHAVLIVGPSGTGKTLTADIIELEFQQGTPPFDVVGEEHGPSYVRGLMKRPDPILFHLRDPWGGNRLTPGADRWSGELPKLLDNAGPGRKFLITSRSDVLHSAGPDLMKDLRPYVVGIEVDDYGEERLSAIYDGIAGDLVGHAKSLARRYRDRALEELHRPYELKRFLAALSREDSGNPRKVADIIGESQIEAISNVIAQQIAPFGVNGAESAAVIWAMLTARGAIPPQLLAKLARRLRKADPTLRPDIDGLTDFLVAGQNLRRDGGALAFQHPRVEDGLRLAFMQCPRDAETAIATLVEVLADWDTDSGDWGIETGLGILRAVDRIDNLRLELSRATHDRLDAFLADAALKADSRLDFEAALRDLARFGSLDHVPSRLSRILIDSEKKPGYPIPRVEWISADIDERDVAALRNDSHTTVLIERFIREILPFSPREYSSDLVVLLLRIGSDLHDAFWDAFDTIAGPGGPAENIDVIVLGALSCAEPDYDRAIERIARSEAEADRWMESFADDFYRAQEHAVDADAADHILEEPGEQYFNSREAAKVFVKLRRDRDGLDWIVGSPHWVLLVRALAEMVSGSARPPKSAELDLLLEYARGWAREATWRAVERCWDDGLLDRLLDEMSRSDLDSVGQRRQLVKCAATHNGAGDPVPDLEQVVGRVSTGRRLELVYDVATTGLDNDPGGDAGSAARRIRAKRLLSRLDEPERELADGLIEIMTGGEIRAAASTLSASARTLLASILRDCPNDMAGPLTKLAAAAGLEVGTVAERLLATGDADDGGAALQALQIENGDNLRPVLRVAMKHKRYAVRREALRLLSGDAAPDERIALLAAAADESADVRLAFVRLMQQHRWPEAIGPLTDLLKDTRNFQSHGGMGAGWSRYSVARAAAQALEAFEGVPTDAIDALVDAAKAKSEDPFVACMALSALANRTDARIDPLLSAALGSAGSKSAQRPAPLAQAAAWALCHRATSGLLERMGPDAVHIARCGVPVLAGPVLIGIGALEGEPRGKLLRELHVAGERDRETLVRVTAIAVGRADAFSLDDRERILLQLTEGETLETLRPDERAVVEDWSRSLNVGSSFERYVAWVAGAAFGLPLWGEVGDIRAFELPEQIGVLTLRSLSPHREEGDRIDDGS